ncbi:MAG TPA: hypothetical protein VII41_00800 [Steroidobacteraceae bacterium]|jgi:hypothetical protein
MILRTAGLALALAAGPALGQENARIEALGTFDQIALECAHDGSESDVDTYRLKLWRSYLGNNASDQNIREMIRSLRAQIIDDVSDELRRQYKASRAAIPEVSSLDDAQQSEFHRLCESPKVNGLPERR